MNASHRVAIFVPVARQAQANSLAGEAETRGEETFSAVKVWRTSDKVHIGWICDWAMNDRVFDALRVRFDLDALRAAGVRWVVQEDPDPALCTRVAVRLEALGLTLEDPDPPVRMV